MKKLKNEKGITLVALIITIVVLLILAVVAIGAVTDSNIIGHAQNAVGSYNQAKANEVYALNKYEEEIEKYVPGEEKEYLGNLRLNTKYMQSGKDTEAYPVIFYANGKVNFGGQEFDYEVEENIVKVAGMKINIIKTEKNDILTIETNEGNKLYATSAEGLQYFSGEKYVCGDKELELLEDSYFWYMDDSGEGIGAIPVFYNGIIYNVYIDVHLDGTIDGIPTTTDNCETIIINGETYTKSIEE